MKLPSFQFYPGDWRKDPGVQALSYHDRGVWFEILCLMHESDERGKLLLNGNPMPDEALARLLGLDKQILTTALTNLLTYGVASRDEATGALICRRMLRDEELRKIRQNCGKKGGNPRLLNQNSNQTETTPVKQIPTPSSSFSSSTSVCEKESAPARPLPSVTNEIEEAFRKDGFPEAWEKWVAYRHARAEGGVAFTSFTRSSDLQACYRSGIPNAIARINFSIAKSGKSLLEPKAEEMTAYLPNDAAGEKPKRELTAEEQRQVLLSRRNGSKS